MIIDVLVPIDQIFDTCVNQIAAQKINTTGVWAGMPFFRVMPNSET